MQYKRTTIQNYNILLAVWNVGSQFKISKQELLHFIWTTAPDSVTTGHWILINKIHFPLSELYAALDRNNRLPIAQPTRPAASFHDLL